MSSNCDQFSILCVDENWGSILFHHCYLKFSTNTNYIALLSI